MLFFGVENTVDFGCRHKATLAKLDGAQSAIGNQFVDRCAGQVDKLACLLNAVSERRAGRTLCFFVL